MLNALDRWFNLKMRKNMFLVGAATVLVALAGQLWWSVEQDKSLTLSAEQKNKLLTVRILEEHASRVFHDAARSLGAIGEELRLDSPSEPLQEMPLRQLLINQRQDSPFLKAISAFDASGKMTATSFQLPSNNFDLREQKQLAYLLAHPRFGGISIGKPVQFLGTGQWVLPVAKNIFDTSGAVTMIVEAEIDLNYFQDFYERVAKDADASISMYDAQGGLMIRAPFDVAYYRTNIQGTALAQRLKDREPEGAVIAPSLLDQSQEFIFTYRATPDFPIAVVFAQSKSSVLEKWRERSWHKTSLALFTLALIYLLIRQLNKQIQQLRISRMKLGESENRYRLLFEDAQDPILLIDSAYTCVDGNKAAITLFGVENREGLLGRKLHLDGTQTDQTLFLQLRGDVSIEKAIDTALQGDVQRFDWAINTKEQVLYTDLTLSRIQIADQYLVFCLMRDVSARKHVEHLLEGQNQLLQLIGGSEDLHLVLQETCVFVEKNKPHWRCGIQLLDDEQRCFKRSVGENFPAFLQEQLVDMPVAHGSGVWSEAVLDAVPIWIANIQQAPSMQFVNRLEELAGFLGCGAWPIMGKSGQLLGVFTLFVDIEGPLSNDDLSLISITTDIASIAIEGKRSEDKVLRLAHYDELTGLPNRFLYNQHLAKSLAHAARNQGMLAVFFLDLDRFKNINDTFGHDEGDRVLRQVAERFSACLRETDTVARVGGDEFILLVDQFLSPRDLGDIADKLLVAAAMPFEIQGQEYQLSASIGIATFPEDGKDAQTLMKNADIAMYRAKNKGKDNYQFYAAEMNVHTVDRLAFEARMRKALERREFMVFYQPKVDVKTGFIVGAEALVRWQHPEKGLLLPGDFIAVAEEAGLINKIGMLVLDITCRDILQFKAVDQSFGRVAINLSGTQFNDAHLLEDIRSVVDFWRVPPSSVELEITEGMVMHNREQAILLMDGLKAAGFTLSIDDFGTGYSSLAYLKRFPVDSVKIDRSFIKDIPDDPNDTAIVLAIVAMAHTLGLKVIAEGVETSQQLQTLVESNCDQYQGFYFSKAVPAAAFLQLLDKQAKESLF